MPSFYASSFLDQIASFTPEGNEAVEVDEDELDEEDTEEEIPL